MILSIKKIWEHVQCTPAPLNESGASFDLSVSETMIIPPGAHYIFRSNEHVALDEHAMGIVYPRSSSNRKGLTVDMTGVVDPGYNGTLIIPVTNNSGSDIVIGQGDRIAQIVFHRVEAPAEVIRSQYDERSTAL